jgi:ribosome-associated protein
LKTQPIDHTILEAVHRAALSKQARHPVALDLRALTPFTDYFYICHGDSARQNHAIADAVLEELSRLGEPADHAEGMHVAEWILLDAGDVIIHIFSLEKREFYSLERLWGDAPKVKLPVDAAPREEEPEV